MFNKPYVYDKLLNKMYSRIFDSKFKKTAWDYTLMIDKDYYSIVENIVNFIDNSL